MDHSSNNIEENHVLERDLSNCTSERSDYVEEFIFRIQVHILNYVCIIRTLPRGEENLGTANMCIKIVHYWSSA